MALSIEERRLKIIEDVCATCGDSGGDGGGESSGASEDSESGGYMQLMKGLKMLDKKKKKKVVPE